MYSTVKSFTKIFLGLLSVMFWSSNALLFLNSSKERMCSLRLDDSLLLIWVLHWFLDRFNAMHSENSGLILFSFDLLDKDSILLISNPCSEIPPVLIALTEKMYT